MDIDSPFREDNKMKNRFARKAYINHKNGNIRKNELNNLEVMESVEDNESKFIELSESEKNTEYISKDNSIREDSGKELKE